MTRVGRQDAQDIVSQYLPMFECLNASGVSYCVVGGIGVMLRMLEGEAEEFRLTRDADVMFDDGFDNADFAQAYLDSYAATPECARVVYEALFGEGTLDDLRNEESRLANASFVGAKVAYDGIETPDFDVVRMLNGRVLADLDASPVVFRGVPIPVASARVLLAMKNETVQLLMASRAETSRPQDFEDIDMLRRLLEHGA